MPLQPFKNSHPSTSQLVRTFQYTALTVGLSIGLLGTLSLYQSDVFAHGDPSNPAEKVEVVSSTALPHVPGKTITLVKVTFPPGTAAPLHHHAGTVTGYVISGTVRSQLKGEEVKVFKAGESFFEPPGAQHLLTENVSKTEPAVILAIFVADKSAELTTYHK